MSGVTFSYLPMTFSASTMTYTVMVPANMMQTCMSSFYIPPSNNILAISATDNITIEVEDSESETDGLPQFQFSTPSHFARSVEDLLARHGRTDTAPEEYETGPSPLLQADFTDIPDNLLEMAGQIIAQRGMFHQAHSSQAVAQATEYGSTIPSVVYFTRSRDLDVSFMRGDPTYSEIPPELAARTSPWTMDARSDESSTASGKLYLDAEGTHTVALKMDKAAGLIELEFSHTASFSGANGHLAEILAEGLTVSAGSVELPIRLGSGTTSVTVSLPTDSQGKINLEVPIEVGLFGETIAMIKLNAETGRLELVGQARQLQPFDLRQFAQQGQKYKDLWRRHRLAANIDHKPVVDLHTHFAGQMTADALLRVAGQSSGHYPVALAREASVDVPAEMIRTDGEMETIVLSDLMRYLSQPGNEVQLMAFRDALRIPPGKVITFQDMEAIYRFRTPIVKDLENFAALLHEIARQYQALGVKYAELSLSDIVRPEWLREAHRVLPGIEAETGVEIRFLAALWRHNAPEFNIEEMGPKIIYIADYSPYVVGVDFMGHETNSTRALTDQIAFFTKYQQERNPGFQIRVHAGENPLFPENVREAISAGATRIGHGLYGVDADTLRLAKEKGVTIEFNLNSNRALNNVDAASQSGIQKELPILEYMNAGALVTLGTDGQGIYGGGGTAESYVAAVAGLNPLDFDHIESADRLYKFIQEKYFAGKTRGEANPGLPADFDLPRTELSAEFWARREAKRQEVRQGLIQNLESRGITVLDDTGVTALFAGRTPVLFSGASQSSWPKISSENQREVLAAIDRVLAMLDPEKTVLVTGATNFGVEKIVHELGRRRGFVILGTIVEETNASEVADGTITHATLVGDSWYSKSAPVLDMIRQNDGAVIFMGGGNILNDEIQAASNVGARFYLMKGPEGASTNKADVFSDRAFVGADGLEKIVVRDMRELMSTEISLSEPAVDEDAVRRIFSPGASAEEMVSALSTDPQLNALYNVPLGYWDGYTIGQHTELVLSRLEKYPLGQQLPQGLGGGNPLLSSTEFVALLSLHDTGKFLPGQGSVGRDSFSQHKRTVAVLEAYADTLHIPAEKIGLMKALIDGDPIGDLFRKVYPYRPPKDEFMRFAEHQTAGRVSIRDYFAQINEWAAAIGARAISAEERQQAVLNTAQAIVETARRLGVNPLEYLHQLTSYYQADCSAYTFDASTPAVKAHASTDYFFLRDESALSRDQQLFHFDIIEQRLRFSSPFEELYRKLIREVEKLSLN